MYELIQVTDSCYYMYNALNPASFIRRRVCQQSDRDITLQLIM